MILTACICMSCSDFLKENHYHQVLPKTAEDYGQLIYTQLSVIESGTTSITLESYKQAIEKECYADNLNASMNNGKNLKIYYAGDAALTNMYVFMRGYKEIKDYNIVLDELPDTDLASHTLRATARIMRAVAYYNLMRNYCDPWDEKEADHQLGLPIVQEFDMEAQPPRSSLRLTVDFITNDLLTAINEGQDDSEMLFTTDVAKAYLAKTYFWSEQWELALKVCKELLSKYPLLEASAYTTMIDTKQRISGNMLLMSGTGLSSTSYNRDAKYLAQRPLSIGFYKLFVEKDKDVRFKYINKKLTTTKPPFIGIRSAEFALMAMECLVHTGKEAEALSMLNQFRSHRIADYTPLTMQTLPPVDNSALIRVDALGRPLTPLLQAILNERRKEMLLEGDRWYELKRNGMPEFWVSDGMNKKETKKYMYNFPLQLRDLLINPALQENPGYIYQQ